MKRIKGMMRLLVFALLAGAVCAAQNAVPTLPPPMGVPAPGPSTDAPYAPQPILPGGVVVPLYSPGSSYLNVEKVRQAEQYNMSQAVPGRINSIVNIHNPSIEVQPSVAANKYALVSSEGSASRRCRQFRSGSISGIPASR